MSAEDFKLNWFLKIVFSIFAFCIGSLVIDVSSANWADSIILARNADFEQQLDGVQLDFENGDGQSCNQRFVLMLYRYQTCFVYEKGVEEVKFVYEEGVKVMKFVRPLELQGKGYFRYIYQAPSSILLGQNKQDAYRFGERYIGRVLMVLNSDGSIMDAFEGNN